MEVATVSPDINKPINQTGQGAKIVEVASNSYLLDEKLLEQILLRDDVKNLPVVVVSVAGPFRAGKSFLLNFFLRYLTAPEEARNENGDWLGGETEPLTGFSWRGGSERHTTGIDMWSEPYIATLPSGDKVAVLLMDTQGTFDSRSTVRDCSTIFALSTLISSVLIYNIKENIKEDDLQHLQLFSEYARLLKNEDGRKAFQKLTFLVRDWPYDYEHAYGSKGGEELLAIRMNETEKMQKELLELRQHIHSSFETISCFLMANPGRNVRKKTFTGSLSEIDVEFKNCLKELMPNVLAPANLTPKLINGEPVKARDLYTLIKAYMEIFNSGKMPSPSSVVEAMEKAALLSAVEEARELYQTRMEHVTSPEQPSLTALALDDEHRKAIDAARTAFNKKKKMASKIQSEAYLAQMTRELQDHLEQYTLLNEGKLRKALDEASDSYDEAIHQVHGEKLLCLHPLDLEEVHKEAVQTALSVFDARRRKDSNMPDLERTKLEEYLNDKLTSLRNENESVNKMAAAMVLTAFDSSMESALYVGPTLDDDDFDDKYQEAKKQTLTAFQNKRSRPTKHDEDSYKDSLTVDLATRYVQLKKINKMKNKQLLRNALQYYETAMGLFWSPGWWCVHPDDLYQKHRELKRKALDIFHPDNSVYEDEDKELLSSSLEGRYNNLKDQNDSTNYLAVNAAVRRYQSEMHEKCKAKWSWLGILPMIVSLTSRSQYHRESKDAAMNEFYDRRRRTSNASWDYYKYILNDRINDIYESY